MLGDCYDEGNGCDEVNQHRQGDHGLGEVRDGGDRGGVHSTGWVARLPGLEDPCTKLGPARQQIQRSD